VKTQQVSQSPAGIDSRSSTSISILTILVIHIAISFLRGDPQPLRSYCQTIMSTHATATFEITGWEPANEESGGGSPAESTDAPTLSRATVKKTFQGDLVGTSVATALLCQSADGAAGGYLAQERVEGRLGEKSGTFVIQHGGIKTANDQKAFGNIVPGTATGELKGLRGKAVIAHDEKGATLTLDYEFE
jgi:Protein of unknown function (DUF3224)